MMSRSKRIFLTLVIAVPIVLIIAYFTRDEDKGLMNANDERIQTFLQSTTEGELEMDHFKRLGDSELFVASFHLNRDGNVQLGYSLLEEVKEGKVKNIRIDFGAISQSFTLIEAEESTFGILYGSDGKSWQQAKVTFPQSAVTYTFEKPDESFYLLQKELDSSIEDPEDYSIDYQD